MNGRREDNILYLPSPHPEQDLRLHLDENISRSVAKLLRNRGFDVTTTNDVGLRAKPDALQMNYACEEQRILVTRDRDFLQLHEQQCAHAGIVYWPHSESNAVNHTQEQLVRLLQRIAESPTIAVKFPAEGERSRRKKRLRKRHTKDKQPATAVSGTQHSEKHVSHKLPAGIQVRGTVQSTPAGVIRIGLTTGTTGWLVPHRLSPTVPQGGQEIEAVTVGYVKSQRQLHLSMRRNYSMARTMPHVGLRMMRRADFELIRTMQARWPVEIEFEGFHTVRLFGYTAEATRDAAHYLQRLIPWTASAEMQLPERAAFKAWIISAYGGVNKMCRATGALVRYRDANRILVCADTNRGLDCLLKLIQTNVPDIQIDGIQLSRSEPLLKCRWASLTED